MIGREASSIYGESLAGVRAETPYRQFNVPVDPYRSPQDPSSGTIYGVSSEPFGEPGQGDKHLAAYAFRLPLTKDPSNQKPITKPEGYNPDHYELHRRFAKAGGEWYTPTARLPNGKTDLIGSEAVLATDLLGMNDGWATGDYNTRQDILQEATNFTKGLLYFFTSDPSLPADVRDEWSQWGYCLDEFPDNDHFPRQLYVRDARRMVSDYVITQNTASEDGEEPVQDPVTVACWPTDTHCARRVVRDGVAHNEGFIFKDGHRWRPFGVSYRSLVPRKSEAVNLITATCPSSSHIGYGTHAPFTSQRRLEADSTDVKGAVRLEHQFYALGQSCAHACDIFLKDKGDIQDISYLELKQRLEADGLVLDATRIPKPSIA